MENYLFVMLYTAMYSQRAGLEWCGGGSGAPDINALK